MRGVAGGLRRMWRRENGWLGGLLRTALLPAEGLYGSVICVRNRFYDRGIFGAVRSPIPVISVGNLAVGGTGKTPFSAWLVSQLSESGKRPALVTRGYGSDEVRLHASWNPDALVVVDPRRARGVALAAERGADVAVLDDGFQHRRLWRDIDIVLLAAEHGTRNPLLPRGPFREPIGALARAHVILVTRRTADTSESVRVEAEIGAAAPRAVRGRIRFRVCGWTDLKGSPAEKPKGDVLVVTSIAEPESFLEMVRSEGLGPAEAFAFRDHHEFTEADVARIRGLARQRDLVTTEKDAVKLSRFSDILPDSYVLRIQPEWESGQDEVMALIHGVLGEER